MKSKSQGSVLPSISTGIATGMIMAFTLSLDDFVISYFTCGHYQTLPIVIYNMTKKSVTPDTYALSTLIFIVIILLLMQRKATLLLPKLLKQPLTENWHLPTLLSVTTWLSLPSALW